MTSMIAIDQNDISLRKTSLAAGILYLISFISVPTLALYKQVKGNNYILNSGSNTSALIGGLMEIVVGLSGIATAIVLFKVLKKQNEEAALGLIAARILEAATIFVGVAFILTIVTLQKDGSGAESLASSHTLATLYNRIFLLGQSFMPAICDALLGFMFYKSGLIPKTLSWIGMLGAPILISGYLAIFCGLIERDAPFAGLSAVPVALFEFSLGIYLVIKGFKPDAVEALYSQDQ